MFSSGFVLGFVFKFVWDLLRVALGVFSGCIRVDLRLVSGLVYGFFRVSSWIV